MTKALTTLSKRKREHDLSIPVTLPGYHLRDIPHGTVRLIASVTDDTLAVDLHVYGEDGLKCLGIYRGTFSAGDLGVSASRRTADYMRKGGSNA